MSVEHPDILWISDVRCHMFYGGFLALGLAESDINGCISELDQGRYPRLDLDVSFKLNHKFEMIFDESSRGLYLSDGVNSYSENTVNELERKVRINRHDIDEWLVERLQQRGYKLIYDENPKSKLANLKNAFKRKKKVKDNYSPPPQTRVLKAYPQKDNYPEFDKHKIHADVLELGPHDRAYAAGPFLCHMYYKNYLVLNIPRNKLLNCARRLDYDDSVSQDGEVIVDVNSDFKLEIAQLTDRLNFYVGGLNILRLNSVYESRTGADANVKGWLTIQLKKAGYVKVQTKKAAPASAIIKTVIKTFLTSLACGVVASLMFILDKKSTLMKELPLVIFAIVLFCIIGAVTTVLLVKNSSRTFVYTRPNQNVLSDESEI